MPGDHSISESDPPAAAIPAWITPALIAETRAAWQPYYEEDLTNEQAVALLIPVGLLYEVLFTGETDDAENEGTDEDAVYCMDTDR